MEVRFLSRAAACAAVLVAVALAGAGCKGNSSTPSGLQVGGTTTGGSTTGGGTTGGGTTGGTPTFRAIAWEADRVLPGDAPTIGDPVPNEAWIFCSAGGTDITINNVLVNGAPVTPTQQQRLRAGGPAGTGRAFFLAIPMPSNGQQITVDATVASSGAPLLSNPVTVVTGGAFSGTQAPQTFISINPPQNANIQAVFAPVNFQWQQAGTAVTYHLNVMRLDSNNLTFSFPFCLEVSASGGAPGQQQSFPQQTGGAITEFARQSLPTIPNFSFDDRYAINWIALDATGWGIGSTIDVPGYNSGTTPGFASWPWFNTQ